MHPDVLLDLAAERVHDEHARSHRRRIHHRRPRSPGALRRSLAALLLRLAARLAGEPAMQYRRA